MVLVLTLRLVYRQNGKVSPEFTTVGIARSRTHGYPRAPTLSARSSSMLDRARITDSGGLNLHRAWFSITYVIKPDPALRQVEAWSRIQPRTGLYCILYIKLLYRHAAVYLLEPGPHAHSQGPVGGLRETAGPGVRCAWLGPSDTPCSCALFTPRISLVDLKLAVEHG